MFTEMREGLIRSFRTGQLARLHEQFTPMTGDYAPTPLPAEPLPAEQARNPRLRANAHAAHRQALSYALMSAPSPARASAAVDAAAALCGELSWSDQPGLPTADASHPAIDLAAAETGALLAWATAMLPELAPSREFLRGEIQRRLLRPAAAHEDYDFLMGRGRCPIAVNADLVMCAALIERDELRFGRLIRALLRAMDKSQPSVGLIDRLIDVTAATDLCALTGQLTDRVPAENWLDDFFCAWICDDLFCDAGDTLNPRLPGCDLFRVGRAAGDRAVQSLGAMLHRLRARGSLTVTGALCAAGLQGALNAETGEPPRLKCGCTPQRHLMVSRSARLCCMLRADTGRVLLFAGRDSILCDGGRSLPLIDSIEPLEAVGEPPQADFDRRRDRENLSADLTRLYPDACGVRSFQRTAMFLREEEAVRLVDVIELEKPRRVVRRLVVGIRPEPGRTGLRIGRVRFTWEGGSEPAVTELGSTRWLITFADDEPVARGIYTWSFEPDNT